MRLLKMDCLTVVYFEEGGGVHHPKWLIYGYCSYYLLKGLALIISTYTHVISLKSGHFSKWKVRDLPYIIV